jgi:hypothetical protein
MLHIVTFRDYTISARSVLVGDGRWSGSYTVCERGKLIRNSSEVPVQRFRELAESAAILLAVQYVEKRLASAQHAAS